MPIVQPLRLRPRTSKPPLAGLQLRVRKLVPGGPPITLIPAGALAADADGGADSARSASARAATLARPNQRCLQSGLTSVLR